MAGGDVVLGNKETHHHHHEKSKNRLSSLFEKLNSLNHNLKTKQKSHSILKIKNNITKSFIIQKIT